MKARRFDPAFGHQWRMDDSGVGSGRAYIL
jgi:hypothetical protein